MADIHILYSPPPEEGEIFPTVAQQEQSGYTIGSTVVQNLSEKPYLPAREAAAAEKNVLARSHNEKMSEITRDELSSTLSAIEERMDKRVERMEKDTDRRAEEFRREMDLRDEAFRREQALREQALDGCFKVMDERFAGFLAAQAERDKRLDESVTAIRSEISRLGNLKLNIWGAMLTAVGVGVAIAALAVTFYQTGKGDQPKPPAPAVQAQQSAPPLAAVKE